MERDKIERDYLLITSTNFPTGGAGSTYLDLFCRGLISEHCSVRVFLLKGFAFGRFKNNGSRKNITEYGVPFVYLGSPQRPENKFLKIFDDLYKNIRDMNILKDQPKLL